MEAEQKGFDFLHNLAFAHRKDALEISNLNKPPEGSTPKKQSAKNRVRGQSFMEKDMKTRKKEKICTVFALDAEEFKRIKAIREKQARQYPQTSRSLEKVGKEKSGFSIKLKITDTPNDDQVMPLLTGKSADHAKMNQVKGRLGPGPSFQIPIQACEKLDSSGDSTKEILTASESAAAAANSDHAKKTKLLMSGACDQKKKLKTCESKDDSSLSSSDRGSKNYSSYFEYAQLNQKFQV